MLAIDAELEANSSLHWKQFATMGIVDKTPMKIIRRLCICFWLPMIREWMGSSLIAYYSEFPAGLGAVENVLMVEHRQRYTCYCREAFFGVTSLGSVEHILRCWLLPVDLHHRARWPTIRANVRRDDHDGPTHNIHHPRGHPADSVRSVGLDRNNFHIPIRLRLRLAGLRLAVLR